LDTTAINLGQPKLMLDIWVAVVSYEVEIKNQYTEGVCKMHIAEAQKHIGMAKFHFEMMLMMQACGRDQLADDNYKKGIDILGNAYDDIDKKFEKDMKEI